MKLTIKAAIQIQKSIEDVFEGIVDPEKMSQYFISESTGWLEDGKELKWKWAEFPEHQSLINNIHVKKNSTISFVWDNTTKVNIDLEEQADQSVIVRVTEGEKELNEKNLKWYSENSLGWANFLDCLKAYLEYGINLRKGAFEFMRNHLPNTGK